ncbi:hypothetical protein Dimus_005467 [Dionaea muscipula]
MKQLLRGNLAQERSFMMLRIKIKVLRSARRDSNNILHKVHSTVRNQIASEKERHLLLASEATNAQEWIVEGGDEEVKLGSGLTWKTVGEAMGVEEILQPRRSARNVGVRELNEEDFVSDEGEQVEEDFDFESDEDRVLEGYGEEEEEILV